MCITGSVTAFGRKFLAATDAMGLENHQDITQVFNAWEQWEKQRQEKNCIVRQLSIKNRKSIEKLLLTASEERWLNSTSYPVASFQKILIEIAQWAECDTPIDIKTLTKFSLMKLHAGLVNAHKDKANQLQNPAFNAIDDLVKHCGTEIDLKTQIILHAVHWIRVRYQQEKQRIARITFDDMLTRLDQALQGSNGAKN